MGTQGVGLAALRRVAQSVAACLDLAAADQEWAAEVGPEVGRRDPEDSYITI